MDNSSFWNINKHQGASFAHPRNKIFNLWIPAFAGIVIANA